MAIICKKVCMAQWSAVAQGPKWLVEVWRELVVGLGQLVATSASYVIGMDHDLARGTTSSANKMNKKEKKQKPEIDYYTVSTALPDLVIVVRARSLSYNRANSRHQPQHYCRIG